MNPLLNRIKVLKKTKVIFLLAALLSPSLSIAENVDPLRFFNNVQLAGNLAMSDVLKFVKTNCDQLEETGNHNNFSEGLKNACLLPMLFSFYYSHEEILRDRKSGPLHLPKKWQAQHVIAGIWNDQYFRTIKNNIEQKNQSLSCAAENYTELDKLDANSCLSELFNIRATQCPALVKSCYAKDPSFYAKEFVANYLLSRIAVTKSMKAVRNLVLNEWKSASSENFQRSIFPAAFSYFHGANELSAMQEYYFAVQCKIDDKNCGLQKSRVGTILFKNLEKSKVEFDKVYLALTKASNNSEVKIPTINRLLEKTQAYQEAVESKSSAIEVLESVLNYTGQLDQANTTLKKIFSTESSHNDFPIFNRSAVNSHFAMVQFMDWYRSYRRIDLLKYDSVANLSVKLEDSKDYKTLSTTIRQHIYQQSSYLFRYLEDEVGGPQ